MPNDIGWKAPAWLERALRDQPDRSPECSALVPIVSHFEALLETDAAQQPPLLNSQERGTVKGCFEGVFEEAEMAMEVKIGASSRVILYFLDDLCIHLSA